MCIFSKVLILLVSFLWQKVTAVTNFGHCAHFVISVVQYQCFGSWKMSSRWTMLESYVYEIPVYVSWVLFNIILESSHCFLKCDRNSRCRCWFAWNFGWILYVSTTPIFWWSHGSLSLLFVMKIMVWHFVRDCHKVMTTLILTLPSKCCCGDFHKIS